MQLFPQTFAQLAQQKCQPRLRLEFLVGAFASIQVEKLLICGGRFGFPPQFIARQGAKKPVQRGRYFMLCKKIQSGKRGLVLAGQVVDTNELAQGIGIHRR